MEKFIFDLTMKIGLEEECAFLFLIGEIIVDFIPQLFNYNINSLN